MKCVLQGMTQLEASQHGIHTLEELQGAEGAHILIAGEDGQGDYSCFPVKKDTCCLKKNSFSSVFNCRLSYQAKHQVHIKIVYKLYYFFFSAYPLSGMITVPMSASMYQAVVANLTGGSGEQVEIFFDIFRYFSIFFDSITYSQIFLVKLYWVFYRQVLNELSCFSKSIKIFIFNLTLTES